MNSKRVFMKILLHIAIILTSILLIEVFLCNYKHYIPLHQNISYDNTTYVISGVTYDSEKNLYRAISSQPTIRLNNIDEKVDTIFVDFKAESQDIYETSISIDYKDESRSNFSNTNKNIKVIPTYENSKYMKLDLNGKVSELRLTINISSGEYFSISKVELNKAIPLNLSIARFLVMFIITISLYSFIMMFHYRKELKNKPILNKVFKISFTVLAIGVVLWVYGYMYNGFSMYVLSNSGSQISKELVDSFMAGKLHLLEEPSESLLALSNPYDSTARSGVSYLWDHLFFEGKYYSYYGIAPVFLLFLPVKLITGLYLEDAYGVLLFSIISIIFISLAYFKFIKKKYPNTPLYLQLFGFIILASSCGVFSNIVRPYFYEVSTSCAFMAFSISLYHLISSNLLFKEKKINIVHSAFFTFWLSIAVLARATYVLYAIAGVIIIALALIERRKELTKGFVSILLVATMSNFVIFGGVQALYNYLRFHNPLEFGIRYSLTINDFTHTNFHISFAWTSVYNYFFAVPKIDDVNYFVHANALTFGQSGYYFFETYDANGLFSRIPLLYMIFVLPFIKVDLNKREKLWFTIKYIFPCIIIPFILAALTWESGFAIRYYSDIAPVMILFIVFVFFGLYEKLEAKNNIFGVKTMATIFNITALFAVIGCVSLTTYYVPFVTKWYGVFDYSYIYKYYRIARELQFWY